MSGLIEPPGGNLRRQWGGAADGFPWVAGRVRSLGSSGGMDRPWLRRRGPGQPGPVRALVAGVPDRVVRDLTDSDRELFANSAANYVARAERHRRVAWAGPGLPSAPV